MVIDIKPHDARVAINKPDNLIMTRAVMCNEELLLTLIEEEELLLSLIDPEALGYAKAEGEGREG